MDQTLLHLFNQVLTNPLMDLFMVTLSVAGYRLLPVLGIALVMQGERRTGLGVLLALGVGLIFTFAFYYLVLRPRPSGGTVDHAPATVPCFSSGHATGAFAVASFLVLTYRQRAITLISLALAALIAFSRLYLGHHNPTDVLGGTVLGLCVGAATYGLLKQDASRLERLRWLLWPQVAIAFLTSEIAYLDFLPKALLRWPFSDKTLHFLLFGAVAFWLNLWLTGQRVQLSALLPANFPAHWLAWPTAILLPMALATSEELLQGFSPDRTVDILDLACDLAGDVLLLVAERAANTAQRRGQQINNEW